MASTSEQNINTGDTHFAKVALNFIKQFSGQLFGSFGIILGVTLLVLSIIGGFWQWFILTYQPYLHLPNIVTFFVDQMDVQLFSVSFILTFVLLIPLISFLTVSIVQFVNSEHKTLTSSELTRATLVNMGKTTLNMLIALVIYLLLAILSSVIFAVGVFTITYEATLVVMLLISLLIMPGIFYAFLSAFVTVFQYNHDYFGSFLENLDYFFNNFKKMWPICFVGYLAGNIVLTLVLLPGLLSYNLFAAMGEATVNFAIVFALMHLVASLIFVIVSSLFFYIYGFGYYYLVDEETKLTFKERIQKGIQVS